MKRCIMAIAMALSLMLSGCGAAKETVHSNYVYMNLMKDDNIGYTVYRFNIDTGKVTTLCPDPLCTHHDCIFKYGLNSFVSGNKIIFPHCHYAESGWKLLAYDLQTGKSEVWYEYNEDFNGLDIDEYITDGYYYCRYTGFYSDNGGKDKEYDENSVMYRVKLATGKVEVIDYLDDVPQACRDGRFWYGKNMLWSTDLEGGDRREINVGFPCDADFGMLDSGIIVCHGIGADSKKLAFVNASTDEFSVTVLEKSIFTMAVCDNQVFFMFDEPDPEFLGHDNKQNSDVYNRSGGKLWHLTPGGEPELFIDFGGDISLCREITPVAGKIVIDYGAFVSDPYWGITTWNNRAGGKIVVDPDGTYTIFERSWNLPADGGIKIFG